MDLIRRCAVCETPIDDLRADATVCRRSSCRRQHLRRRARGDDYQITDEDRAAIRRVLERDGHGCPLPTLTPDQVAAHVLATAERT